MLTAIQPALRVATANGISHVKYHACTIGESTSNATNQCSENNVINDEHNRNSPAIPNGKSQTVFCAYSFG
jgi:hypothetical protein